jgi:hypothetical protein
MATPRGLRLDSAIVACAARRSADHQGRSGDKRLPAMKAIAVDVRMHLQ